MSSSSPLSATSSPSFQSLSAFWSFVALLWPIVLHSSPFSPLCPSSFASGRSDAFLSRRPSPHPLPLGRLLSYLSSLSTSSPLVVLSFLWCRPLVTCALPPPSLPLIPPLVALSSLFVVRSSPSLSLRLVVVRRPPTAFQLPSRRFIVLPRLLPPVAALSASLPLLRPSSFFRPSSSSGRALVGHESLVAPLVACRSSCRPLASCRPLLASCTSPIVTCCCAVCRWCCSPVWS